MARAGRTLELLIARLETLVSGGSAVVASPEYVVGRNSQSRREVDVSVRSTVGSTNVFVAFECRDRQETNDVRWIEELASKREDIGANSMIAVSTSAFSSGAIATAAAKQIDLRMVEEISHEDVSDWLQLTHLDVHVRQTRNQDFQVAMFDDTPPLTVAGDGIPVDTPIFAIVDPRVPASGVPYRLSGQQLHEMAMEHFWERDDLPELDDWTPIRMEMSNEDSPLISIETEHGLFPLALFVATAEVRIEKSQEPLTFQIVATGEGRPPITVAQAISHVDGKDHVVSFTHTDEWTHIGFHPSEDDPDDSA